MKVCKINDCDRVARVGGACNMHYARFWRHGSYDSLLPAPPCKICGKKHYAKGYCVNHWRKYEWANAKEYWKARSLGTYMGNGVCSVPGCGRGVYCKGICKKHYAQKKRTGKMFNFKPCQRPDCTSRSMDVNLSYCSRHHAVTITKFQKLYGSTLVQMGELLGISRQRVQQLHKEGNLTKRLDKRLKEVT